MGIRWFGAKWIVAGLLVTMPAMARDKAPSQPKPFHYTVRFGAMIGSLEAIAGEMLCVSDKDCEILLSFWPRIELSLRPPHIRGGEGQASISCWPLKCMFANERGYSTFSMGVDRLTIYDGRHHRSGIEVDAVWRRHETIGSVTIVVTR
ncbi:hypothetical protein NS226_09940 [Aureimonas ureilytica]|uniref:Uncharacterized protein n=1 Tax=Aureimonas ureilytica TaxID=401562 RepID=A0A175R8Q3_9HYPH|nr:hypothetical protein NS226_09940 [Aureimonas ureilytica]